MRNISLHIFIICIAFSSFIKANNEYQDLFNDNIIVNYNKTKEQAIKILPAEVRYANKALQDTLAKETDSNLVDSTFTTDTISAEYIDSLSIALAFSDSIANAKADSIANAQADSAMAANAISKQNINKEISSSLIIPSYEELLEVYYKSVVAVDKRINDNPYRLMPGNFATVNPFTYKNVIFSSPNTPDLSDYKNFLEKDNVFDKNAYQIVNDTRAELAKNNPELIDVTLGMLPNPPKTERASIIYKVNLDLKKLNKESTIAKPDKIEKQNRYYQPWQTSVWATLNINQTTFHHWANGGTNSFSIAGNIDADADYISLDKKTRWDNDLEINVGYIKQKDKELTKNLDNFRINTQFARNAINKWYYSASTELTSQLFKTYASDTEIDPISMFFAPAYLKVNLGFDYKFETEKNKKLFSLQASPASYKMTFVRDTAIINQEKFGVDADKKSRQEIGGSIILSSEYNHKDKFSGKTRLSLFSNYLNKPQNIDINWNTTLIYRISRVFSINFTLDMIYDDDIDILISQAEDGTKKYGQRLQVKEYVGFGLTYRLK